MRLSFLIRAPTCLRLFGGCRVAAVVQWPLELAILESCWSLTHKSASPTAARCETPTSAHSCSIHNCKPGTTEETPKDNLFEYQLEPSRDVFGSFFKSSFAFLLPYFLLVISPGNDTTSIEVFDHYFQTLDLYFAPSIILMRLTARLLYQMVHACMLTTCALGKGGKLSLIHI